MINTWKTLALVVGISSASLGYGAAVGVDGVLGAEWSGSSFVQVNYDPLAPIGNFGTPGTVNHMTAYKIYTRADASYVYGFLQAESTQSPLFANLYFDTNPFKVSGSDVGFELNNNRAFIPGVSGYYDSLGSYGLELASIPGNIEFALPWSYFVDDPQNIGFAKITATDNFLRLNLSQSFGLSVAGGQANYGNNRLGLMEYTPAAVPDVGSTAGLTGVALLVLGWLRRRTA